MRHLVFGATLFLLCGLSFGQAKQVPPPANAIAPADRAELEKGLSDLGREIEALRGRVPGEKRAPLADVEVFHKAVQWPLRYGEILDVKKARAALAVGMERAKRLAAGEAPWVEQGGVRAYVSKIDGSIQPYIVYLPKGYAPDTGRPYRLDFFCHGRDEKLMELNFILGKAAGSGEAKAEAPEGRIVVHPYGRYCNANKFAGEIDVLEVLEDVKKRYPIDADRVVMTGFSMGGASAWHLAVHYADRWAAASPGAGFAETKEYQKLAQKGELAAVPWYEQTLWHLYDAPDWAVNLFHCPTIAYAGEEDPQKQAGDVMERALAAEGMKLERIWGPKTGHKYEPGAKKILDARLDELAAKGRDRLPKKVRFTTWTLRYDRMHWLTVEGLERHWTQGRVEAELVGDGVSATTRNVSRLALKFDKDHSPFRPNSTPMVTIDGTRLAANPVAADGSFEGRFEKADGKWRVLSSRTGPDDAGEPLRKRHGLQGPIDDAFMNSFIIVRPTGRAMNELVGTWADAECDRAVGEWRKVFRGEARVRNDTEVTEADIAESNLILFGDPAGNAVLAKIAAKLPVKWTDQAVTVGRERFDAATHAPVMIYPNPLNPKKYVVLNSGFTFREGSNISNSRQVPRLPDYAVVDLSVPATNKAPGRVAGAGFFGENWEVKEPTEAIRGK